VIQGSLSTIKILPLYSFDDEEKDEDEDEDDGSTFFISSTTYKPLYLF
jgi:hypothetical protein